MSKVFLAIDLGAESGRAVAGEFDGRKLELRELHRFPNGASEEGGELHWDIQRLFTEIKTGISKAAKEYGDELESMGVDTWGVDYGLLDNDGELLCKPFQYRDSRTNGMEDAICEKMPRRDIYEATGIQFMFFNTLLQVYSEVAGNSKNLSAADRLLFIPDLINYWLTGKKVNERTIASTSQMLDPRTGKWAETLLDAVGIPSRILGEIVEPGTDLGGLTESMKSETGVRSACVVAPGCHDTASAVAAVPAAVKNYAYVSSGTWSLMGSEIDGPVVSDKSYEYNFTNEGGVCNTIRLLKNICGMWIVQECKRNWAEGGDDIGYSEITKLAAEAEPFVAFIDPDHSMFSQPCDMPEKMKEYCEKTGQRVPETRGSLVRTAFESLALKYKATMGMLEDLGGEKLEALHIVGGGCQNRLLNQMSADAAKCPVVTGPVEATSAGNILMQMLATGHIASLQEGRDVIRASFETETFEPVDIDKWDEAYEKSKEALGKVQG